MAFSHFDDRVRSAMARRPSWFSGAESPASDDDIARLEVVLGRALPCELKHFAKTFGAGYFGARNISSLKEASDWYILSRPTVSFKGRQMLVVSDDEAGGCYGFDLDGDNYGPGIFYTNPDDGDHTENVASSFFSYVENNVLDL